MSHRRKNSGLWAYLDAKGVLENGSEEDIKTAKREYWKQYHYQHRKTQRQEKPEFVVSLAREDGTYDRIAAAARKHKLSVPAFLRTATLSYLNQVYVVPDHTFMAHLEELLSQCANEIQVLAGAKEKYFWQREQKIETIDARIEKLENEVAELFRHPLSLEDFIRREVSRTPELKDRLLALLATHDRKSQIT